MTSLSRAWPEPVQETPASGCRLFPSMGLLNSQSSIQSCIQLTTDHYPRAPASRMTQPLLVHSLNIPRPALSTNMASTVFLHLFIHVAERMGKE